MLNAGMRCLFGETSANAGALTVARSTLADSWVTQWLTATKSSVQTSLGAKLERGDLPSYACLAMPTFDTPHIRAAAGATIGAVQGEGPSLLLDTWNRPHTTSAVALRALVSEAYVEDFTQIIMCIGLPGSGKTAAAYSLARDLPVIMLTASALGDTDRTLPQHATVEWRCILQQCQIASTDDCAANEQWMSMAFTMLLYMRLVQLQVFTEWAAKRGLNRRDQRQQWMVAQRGLNSSVELKAALSTWATVPVTARGHCLASMKSSVRVLLGETGNPVLVIDESQRMNEDFPVAFPDRRVR